MIPRIPKLSQPAWAVLAAVAILFSLGLLCIYATEAARPYQPTRTIKQSINLVVAGIAFLIVLRIGYAWFARYAIVIVVLCVLALIPLVLARSISFGDLIPQRRGAYRWIQLPGYSLQPSEFMKIAYIVGLAAYLRYRSNVRTFHGLLIPMIASVIPFLLILMEPDLGTVLLLMPVLLVMLFAAGARIRHFVAVGAVGLMFLPLFWAQLQPYQRSRLLAVVLQSEQFRQKMIEEPQRFSMLGTARQAREWEVGAGLQLVRSKAALGSGGVQGNGWGQGAFVEYSFLPDKHNDFIFAMIGHQWGLTGCLLVILCYAIMVIAGVEIAAGTTDPFARLIAVGVVSLLASQVVTNIGMTIGLLPITGMTLPFVSYGGSSILTYAICIGLLVSVSQRKPFLLADRPFEFESTEQRESPVKPGLTFRT